MGGGKEQLQVLWFVSQGHGLKKQLSSTICDDLHHELSMFIPELEIPEVSFPVNGSPVHHGLSMTYPLVNIQKTMERSTIFHGKTHYFYGHFQELCQP